MASTEMLEALFRAAGALPSVAQLDAMREATCVYVEQAKREGQTPERIVIALRGSAQHASGTLPASVIESLIAYCVKKYFETPHQ